MKNMSALLKEQKIKPMIFGSFVYEDNPNKPIVFQEDTHYKLDTNPFNYSYDVLPFDAVNSNK